MTVYRSRKLSLEPQESTNPSRLSGIQRVKPVALSWLKREKTRKRVQENKRALSFFYFNFEGENIFVDSFINQDSKFIDT